MMFKTGDDMRQDALVLQIFGVMDKLLRDIGLDLKFTLYNLISFTNDDGLLQFTPNSKTITDIKKDFSSKPIESYLRKYSANEEDYQKKLDTYICSVAGYCVATYLLGIGDRHLENIMITQGG